MIQRVQSIWLLLAAAAAFFTLNFSFYSGNFIDPKVTPAAKTFVRVTAQSNVFLLILTVGVGIAAIIAIFLYKDRKQQLRVVLAAIVASLINIVLYFLQVGKFVPGEGAYEIWAVLIFIVPIFLILAARGIYRDQKLIKSLDRLR